MEVEPEFVEKVSDDLVCPVCRTLLQEPQQTDCGHDFCRDCVRHLMKDGKLTCPVCRAESLSNQIFDDKRLKREIMGLRINCDQNGRGCTWSGELRQREKHSGECGYVTEPCVNECGQVVMRKEMKDHKDSYCPLRIAVCGYCKDETRLSLLLQHYTECGKYPVPCMYRCGVKVAREDMEEHTSLEGTCPNSPLDCEFYDVGCKFKGTRHELNKHIETSSTSHCRLLLAEMRDIRQKLFVESEQRKLAMPTGQFIYMWKIDDWQHEVDTEKEMLQSSLFSVDPGYHMAIVAYPCGDDDSDNHLSLFLCPAIGDFDSELNWPFAKSFTLSVVDQQLDGQNISKTSGPLLRFGFDGPNDIGYGWSSFATHEELKTRCYIKDDAVLIKLSVQL